MLLAGAAIEESYGSIAQTSGKALRHASEPCARSLVSLPPGGPSSPPRRCGGDRPRPPRLLKSSSRAMIRLVGCRANAVDGAAPAIGSLLEQAVIGGISAGHRTGEGDLPAALHARSDPAHPLPTPRPSQNRDTSAGWEQDRRGSTGGRLSEPAAHTVGTHDVRSSRKTIAIAPCAEAAQDCWPGRVRDPERRDARCSAARKTGPGGCG